MTVTDEDVDANSSLGCEGSSTRTPWWSSPPPSPGRTPRASSTAPYACLPRICGYVHGDASVIKVVDLTSVTVVVSPGAACGERGLDDGRPGVAAPFLSSSEFYRHSAGCWAQ